MYVLELFNGAESPSPRRKVSLTNIKEDSTMPDVTDQPVTQSNPEDKITLDVPLLIRIMEYAREDAKTDMDLHDVAERLISLSANGNTLTMSDYESIVGGEADKQEPVDNSEANAAAMRGESVERKATIVSEDITRFKDLVGKMRRL
jgi:hypothetical protein